jgi:formate-dependent nitrite reductase cytochrome c552 subunit
MDPRPTRQENGRTNLWLGGLAVVFLGLAGFFMAGVRSPGPTRTNIALVDPKFLATTPWRQTYADLAKAGEDLSDYDCYGCHEKNNPPTIRFDAKGKIIVPKEHSNIVMGHGSHDRNDLCYNCHNEQNLETLQVRDGRQVKFDNIPPLCGSCHGPTLRDWDAGAHGRTGGYWNRSLGEAQRLSCANCHNPHAPRIPKREPAPGPHTLHEADAPAGAEPSH